MEIDCETLAIIDQILFGFVAGIVATFFAAAPGRHNRQNHFR
jgi:hypothetical protein